MESWCEGWALRVKLLKTNSTIFSEHVYYERVSHTFSGLFPSSCRLPSPLRGRMGPLLRMAPMPPLFPCTFSRSRPPLARGFSSCLGTGWRGFSCYKWSDAWNIKKDQKTQICTILLIQPLVSYNYFRKIFCPLWGGCPLFRG